MVAGGSTVRVFLRLSRLHTYPVVSRLSPRLLLQSTLVQQIVEAIHCPCYIRHLIHGDFAHANWTGVY